MASTQTSGKRSLEGGRSRRSVRTKTAPRWARAAAIAGLNALDRVSERERGRYLLLMAVQPETRTR